MSRTSFLKYCRLAYLSGPPSERELYRKIAKNKPTRILEIGLGLGVRTLRMFDVVRRYCNSDEINYTGIDLFESRSADAASMSLKDAYKLLRQQRVKVKLIPGDALAAMTMTANTLANTDLILIDSDIHDVDLELAWRYFPRMMHDQTLVLRQTVSGNGKTFEQYSMSDIRDLAKQSTERVAAAA